MGQHFLVQRIHPSLRVGIVPSVVRGRNLIPVHCAQGQWDSACGAHCAAMALAILGEISDVRVLSERSRGVAARLWRATYETYFHGIDAERLAATLDSLSMGRSIKYHKGRHTACLSFALQHVGRGELVIASWHSRRGRTHHWTLLIGQEGTQKGRVFVPTTLLALDPGVPEPQFCGYNARIEHTVHPKPRSPMYVRYLTADSVEMAVRLTSAVAIGAKPRSNT